MREDLLHGLRMMRRKPAFAVAVVLLLALGIGTTTIVYSLVETVLLNPLPYPSPERLTVIWEATEDGDTLTVAPGEYRTWRAARSFSSMAAVYLGEEYLLAGDGGGEPDQVLGGQVESDLFEVLGAEAAMGRVLLPSDDLPGAADVTVLADGLWKRSFGGSPDVVGTTVVLNGRAHTVVGVMPPGFKLLTRWPEDDTMELWAPLDLSSKDQGVHSLYVVARLADGVTVAQAQAEMEAIAAAVGTETHKHGVRVVALHDDVVGHSEAMVLMLFAAAVFVLLIACANAGSLLVAKTAARDSELAIRSSLGASRARLIRQLLVENLAPGILGGFAGVALAAAGLRVLRQTIPVDIPRAAEMAVDGSVLAFTAGVTLLVVLLMGLAPALAASGHRLMDRLRQGRFQSVRAGRSRRLLIAVQLALTLALAHGAGLMLTSYARLQATDLGFDPEVVTTRLVTYGPHYENPEQVTAFVREVVRQVESQPGVASAAVSDALPLYSGPRWRMRVEGREDTFDGERAPYIGRFLVTPNYFRTLGIRLVRGRLLAAADLVSELPVAVVNQAMARRLWGDEDPVGRRFSIGPKGDWITVVGVVTNVHHFDPEQPPFPASYLPLALVPAYGWVPQMEILSLVVRGPANVAALAGPLKETVRSVDPAQPVAELRTLEEMLHSLGARRRFNTLVITTFAGLGVILIGAGIYALISTYVTQRGRDIGVRIALGATTRGVLRLVLAQGAGLLVFGIGGGLAVVAALSRLVEGLLYAVSPTEPILLGIGVAFVALVAMVGSLVPALKATRIDPAMALRDDN